MALIRCRECGREISDAAVACPGCGAPVRATPAPAALAGRTGWSRVATVFGAWLIAPWFLRALAFIAGIAMLIAMFALSR